MNTKSKFDSRCEQEEEKGIEESHVYIISHHFEEICHEFIK